jgi:signal transduction histidine kinase
MMLSTVHEIRNQLAVAVANIEAFIDGKIAPTPDRLNSVLQALLEVDVLIDDLAPGSGSEAKLNLELVDVCKLIETELIAIEATAVAANIELRVDRCADKHAHCAAFVCDPGQVIQVVKNILLNAFKYTPPGGFVAVNCHREPGVLVLSVDDDGPGVQPDERHAIFEAGVRGSAATDGNGSGMGLSVVKRIVDRHGGAVTVQRGALGGAEFVIRLPGTLTLPVTCAQCARAVTTAEVPSVT